MSEIKYLAKISEKLMKSQPDVVKQILDSRITLGKYPYFIHDFILNTLQSDSSLKNEFQNLEETTEDKDSLYDSIFNLHQEEEKDNIEESTKSTETQEENEIQEDQCEDNFTTEEEAEAEFDNDDDDETQDDPNDESYFNDDEFICNDTPNSLDFDFSISIEEEVLGPPQIIQIFDEEVTKATNVADKQDQSIQNVSQILKLSTDATYLLLKKFNWSSYKLFDYYSEHNSTFHKDLPSVIKVPESLIDNLLSSKSIGKGECPICCNEDVELLEVYCGHVICKECLKNEIETQIESKVFPIVCRFEGCNSEIMLHEIERLIDKEKAYKYRLNYIEFQMQIDLMFSKCPSPNCPNFLNQKFFNCCHIGTCKCGKEFCMDCLQDVHAPIKCNQIEKW